MQAARSLKHLKALPYAPGLDHYQCLQTTRNTSGVGEDARCQADSAFRQHWRAASYKSSRYHRSIKHMELQRLALHGFRNKLKYQKQLRGKTMPKYVDHSGAVITTKHSSRDSSSQQLWVDNVTLRYVERVESCAVFLRPWPGSSVGKASVLLTLSLSLSLNLAVYTLHTWHYDDTQNICMIDVCTMYGKCEIDAPAFENTWLKVHPSNLLYSNVSIHSTRTYDCTHPYINV